MLHWLAEKRIQEAIESGELDHYTGKGEPFPDEFFSENPYVPQDMKQAMKFLRNANIMPHEVLLRREIDYLKVKIKSKKITTDERTKLLHDLSIKEIEYQARLELYRN